MPTLSSMKVPAPSSWEEFEQITLDACKIRWENPDLQMHGRRGQAQNGIDIYGSNHIFENVGVQCKNYNSDISISLIKDEIEKAELFTPKIQMFYLATTKKTDVKIQREIKLLSHERTKENKFAVMLLFWDDIIQDLSSNERMFYKHYPQLNVGKIKKSTVNDIRLFSILDLVYNTFNLDFYIELIFGEFGQMAGENPLQIKSVLSTIKNSASNVLPKSDYKIMKKLVEDYEQYLFDNGKSKKKFSWSVAEQISNKFTGIVEGLEYKSTVKELAVFNLAKILAKWSKWETETESYYPKSSWHNLKKFVEKLQIKDLTERIDEMEIEYEKMDHFKKVDRPHDIYNEIRKALIHNEK